jgi:uncharacterized membrane protein
MAFLLAGWRSASEGRCGILNTAGMNKPIIYALAAMVCYGFSDFIYKQAAAAGQASVLVPIAQMGFVVAALLGIFVLRERVTLRKVMGLVLGLAALAALAGS